MLDFRAEQQVCPIDGQPLKVLKISTKTVHSTILGTFQARHTELYCPGHKDLGVFKCEDLQRIVPACSNFAYDAIVEIGKQRYLHHRQIEEIRRHFRQKFNLTVSNSEIASQIVKFISYLSAVHQDNMEQIKAYIQAQGGYIFHLDSTCEGDSPKLTSSIDAVSGFVLQSAKLKSENEADIVNFLLLIKEQLGPPHAVITDMGRGMIKAVKKVFPDRPHYICHFHFLCMMGKLLFDEENNILRKKLSLAGVSGKLKALKRELENRYERSVLDNLFQNLNQPMLIQDESHSLEPLVYSLICWILDYPSAGNGYGFPFDRSYLEFYLRLQEAMEQVEKYLSLFPYDSKQTKILGRLRKCMFEVTSNKNLRLVVKHYQTKVEVFERLRRALRAAPQESRQGLSDLGTPGSAKEIKAIKKAVDNFARYLDKKILLSKNKTIRNSFQLVQKRIEKYQPMLLSDPIEVEAGGKKRLIFINRTNNILEQHFRVFSYNHQRITGNGSMKKTLKSMHPSTPLVMNLKNENYIRLIFGDEHKIAHKFAQVDVLKVREDIHNKTAKKFSISKKSKKILRDKNFLEKLNVVFEKQSMYAHK